MGSELAAGIQAEVHGLLNHFMAGRWKDVAPGIAAVTDTGVCYMYNDSISLKAGFCAVAGVEMSAEVLEKLVEVNALNRLAHAWVRPDATPGSGWSVMVTFKLAYAWTVEHELRQFMYTVLTNQEMILEIVQGLVLPFGGRPFWQGNGGMHQVDVLGYQLAADLGA